MSYYGTIQGVVQYSGAQPEMLGLTTQVDMEERIQTWLEQATEYINQDRNRDYAAEGTVPKGIDNIAERMVSNMIRNAQRQRTGSVIQVDGRDLVIDDSSVFSSAIMKDLRRYPRKPKFGMMILPVPDTDDEDST